MHADDRIFGTMRVDDATSDNFVIVVPARGTQPASGVYFFIPKNLQKIEKMSNENDAFRLNSKQSYILVRIRTLRLSEQKSRCSYARVFIKLQ